MKRTYLFKEINYGSIEIDSDRPLDDGDVINAIGDGGAYYKNTDYEDITLYEPEKTKKG